MRDIRHSGSLPKLMGGLGTYLNRTSYFALGGAAFRMDFRTEIVISET
jgi:hypothetical protein